MLHVYFKPVNGHEIFVIGNRFCKSMFCVAAAMELRRFG